MDVQFVASVAPIVRDVFTHKLERTKHFGL